MTGTVGVSLGNSNIGVGITVFKLSNNICSFFYATVSAFECIISASSCSNTSIKYACPSFLAMRRSSFLGTDA